MVAQAVLMMSVKLGSSSSFFDDKNAARSEVTISKPLTSTSRRVLDVDGNTGERIPDTHGCLHDESD